MSLKTSLVILCPDSQLVVNQWRFRYRCAGMGLSASSEEWCWRMVLTIGQGNWRDPWSTETSRRLPHGGWDDRRAPVMSLSRLGQLLVVWHHNLQMETWGCYSSEVCGVPPVSQWYNSRPLPPQSHHQLPKARECHCLERVHWVD